MRNHVRNCDDMLVNFSVCVDQPKEQKCAKVNICNHFLGLGLRRGVCEEGVWVIWGVKVYDLLS